MSKFNLTTFSKSESNVTDPLTELLRWGARELISQAVEAELQTLLNQHAGVLLEDGRQAVVRNGYLPERVVQTGIGTIRVKVPKARDRSGSGISFSSRLLPPYHKRTQGIDERLLCLYLKSISTGDFRESLVALLGNQAKTLSISTISRLNEQWFEEHSKWRRCDLTSKRYVYLWADGIHNDSQIDGRQSLLVVTGITEQGRKELVIVEEGYRESEASWEGVLCGLRERGLNEPPKLAIGDGALGLGKAMTKMYPTCRHQFCWAHKTADVLSKLPESMQSKVKNALRDIWMAATREEAHAAFDRALEQINTGNSKAMDCLANDKTELLAFYDFPVEHWENIRRPTRLNRPSSQSHCAQSAHAIAAFKTKRWVCPSRC